MGGYRIVVLGHGGDIDPPAAYEAPLRVLLEELATPAWQLWWTGSEYGVLEVSYRFDGDAFDVVTRRHGERVDAAIIRPLGSIPSGSLDAAELASRDVSALAAAVTARLWLAPPPPVPDAAAVLAELAARAAAETDRHERLALLVACLRDRLPHDHAALTERLGDGPAAVTEVVDVLVVRLLTGELELTDAEGGELRSLARRPT